MKTELYSHKTDIGALRGNFKSNLLHICITTVKNIMFGLKNKNVFTIPLKVISTLKESKESLCAILPHSYIKNKTKNMWLAFSCL
ncbi:hypothetical protein GDO86_005761 [Hymenochirus boettgeri]|uniref:Uncharacterized protein n=1 Tax=Hymenochirus boettgeri TaxID=247094 RepID=A0A8T2J7Y7_9PIPI|nr:hypothetical protein GDO86_005761 [Hymenochirus boettgeri]